MNIQLNERTHLVVTNFCKKVIDKSRINRLRPIYNVLTNMDESIVPKLRSLNAQKLTNFFTLF